MSDVALYVNNEIYRGWLEASIAKSMKAIAGRFSLSVTATWRAEGRRWFVAPQDTARLEIDKSQIITGYVDEVSIGVTAGSRKISFSGRDKAGDLVDCSYDGSPEINNVNLTDLASKLFAPFGIKVIAETNVGAPFSKFAINPGETVFEAVERAARLRGVLLVSDGLGAVRITSIGKTRSKTALVEGQNLLSLEMTFNGSERFSEYKVKGQKPGSDWSFGASTSSIVGTAKDSGVTRYRPLVIVAEGSVDDAIAKKRADWEKFNRIAKSSKFTAEVKGWRDGAGELWDINKIVQLKSPYLGFNADVIISELELVKNEGGEIARMGLEPPDAYAPDTTASTNKKKKKGEPDDFWELLKQREAKS